MGWLGAITRSVGRAGQAYGEASDQRITDALGLIQQKLMIQEIQQRVKESQQRLQQQNRPQLIPLPGGGTAQLPIDPATNTYGKPQTLVPGGTDAKTLDQAWIEAKTREDGRPPSAEAIEAHYQSERTKPIDDLINQGILMAQAGNQDGAKTMFNIAQMAAGAKKGGASSPSVLSLIMKANAGDPEAAKALKVKMEMDKDLARTRGEAFGAGRAMYQISAYADPTTGELIPMSNFDAIQAIKNGRNLVPSGRLPANMLLSVQQLVSEAGPALKAVRANLGAYDNSTDRAIFARILANNPAATVGQETTWMSNILNQAAASELSPEGRALVVRLNRLNESVGRLRGVLGLPGTERMVAMTLGMVPGPSTPDSAMATDILDNLDQTINNAVSIPMLKGLSGGKEQVREFDLTH